MFYIAGGFFVLLSVIKFIAYLVRLGRPKVEVTVKEFFLAKMKTDVFGMYPDMKHAKVSFDVNGKSWDADIMLPKNTKVQLGETIRISYLPKDPRIARLYNPKLDIVPTIVMFVFGVVICVINQLILNSMN